MIMGIEGMVMVQYIHTPFLCIRTCFIKYKNWYLIKAKQKNPVTRKTLDLDVFQHELHNTYVNHK